jgi:hypothetical protein
VKTIDTLDAYINLEQHYVIEHEKKKMKCKTYHKKSEEKGEFRSPRNEFLYFKKGTPIMLGPHLWMLEDVHDIFALVINILEIN